MLNPSKVDEFVSSSNGEKCSISEKVVCSESGVKYAEIKHRLQAKTVQNSSKQICVWILMWEDNREWTF